VGVLGHGLQDVAYVLGDLPPSLEILHHLQGLVLRGHVTRQEEVPESLHIGVVGTGYLGERLEGFGNGLAAEANALVRIQVGDVGHQAFDAARSADDLSDCYIHYLFVRMLLEQPYRPWTVRLDLLL
jgi:hypothetical protein